MTQKLLTSIQKLFSWFGLLAAVTAVVIVIGSYLLSATQPYRGPTTVYFVAFLFFALISKHWATATLIFILPLLPNLATQAEFVIHPAVKYFVAYPGIDAIIGLFVGQCLRSVLIDKNLGTWLKPPPWPFGVALFVITLSCLITIDRNLIQSGADFSWQGVLSNIFRFKHSSFGNSFSPINDFLVFSTAMVLVIALLETLKNAKSADDVVFKPLIAGLIVASLWGLMQAATGFGLPGFALTHRSSTIGFSAYGFQPDIHAFAAHMLLGAVGLFSYIRSLRQDGLNSANHWRSGALLACALSWIALFFSKSRASLIFALFVACSWILIFLYQRKSRISIKKFGLAFLVLTAVIGYLSLSDKFWLIDIWAELKTADLTSLDSLNKISAHRLEIFAGALKMFAEFPWLGIGQDNFRNQSSNLAFMGSSWTASMGGENAHNYFLQTLAELGTVGFASLLVVFLWPLYKSKNRRALAPTACAIGAVFLGNLFSHSLIIRENLYLLALFVSLLYAHTLVRINKQKHIERINSHETVLGYALIMIMALGLYMGSIEVIDARKKYPFLSGSVCYSKLELYPDGWTSGILQTELPYGKIGALISAKGYSGRKTGALQVLDVKVTGESGDVLKHLIRHYSAGEDLSIRIEVPEDAAKGETPRLMTLRLSQCHVPSQLGLGDDNRKLGIQIKSIDFF
jgi:O-antigen ligase